MQNRNTAIVIIAALALATVVMMRGCGQPGQPPRTGTGAAQPRTIAAEPDQGAKIYDIGEMSSIPAAGAAVNPSVPESIKEVYQSYPKTDVGGDMIKAWEAVSPEQKKVFNEEIDKQIDMAKQAYAANPADKKAKHMLFIAETMKQLAADGFDYRRTGGSAVTALQSEVKKRAD